MRTDYLNDWLQILGTFGLLIGLILVGFEMRQNSELLRTELTFSENQRAIDYAQALAGENPSEIYAKHLINLEDLTFEEQIRIDAFYFMYFENWRSLYNLYLTGLIENEWRERIEIDAIWLINNPYGRARWEIEKDILPAEVVEYADRVLAENPLRVASTGTLSYYERLYNNAITNERELIN